MVLVAYLLPDMGTQITGVEKLCIVETNYVGTWAKRSSCSRPGKRKMGH